MRKAGLWWAGAKFMTFNVLELVFQVGLLSQWHDGSLPRFIAESGFAELIVAAYLLWLFVEPIVYGIALLIQHNRIRIAPLG